MPEIFIGGRWQSASSGRRREIRCPADGSLVGHVDEAGSEDTAAARMGVDEMSVLDPRSMRVHDVDGLRVVDASAMPYITNGNIYAPVMMLAEKSADLILGNTPLPPATAPFYRHRDGSPLYPPGDPRNTAQNGARQ